MKLPENAKALMREYILLTDDLYNQRHKEPGEHIAAEKRLRDLHEQLFPNYQDSVDFAQYQKDDEKSGQLELEVRSELEKEMGRKVGDWCDTPDHGTPLVNLTKDL